MNETEQIINTNENIEQPIATADEQIAEQLEIDIEAEEIEQPYSASFEENDQIPVTTTVELEQNVALDRSSDQLVPEGLQEENSKETVTFTQEVEQTIIAVDEQRSLPSDENTEISAETTSVNTFGIDVNDTEESMIFPIEHEQINSFSHNILSMSADDNRFEQVTSEVVVEKKSVPCIVELEHTEKLLGENEDSNQVFILAEEVERSSVENPSPELPSNAALSTKETEPSSIIIVENNPMLTDGKSEEFTIEESSRNTISNEETTIVATSSSIVKQVEEPVALESQRPVASNESSDRISATMKKSTINTKIPVSTASSQSAKSHSPVFNAQGTSSLVTVEPPPPMAAARATIPKPIKYSEIVRKPTPPKAPTKPRQEAVPLQRARAEPSTVTTPKTISSSIMSSEKSKQSHVTAEKRIEQVSLTSAIQESVQPQVSLDEQDRFTTNLEEPSASMQSNKEDEAKKSPEKTKKSRRSNAKKNKAKISLPQPSPTIIVEEPIFDISTISTQP